MTWVLITGTRFQISFSYKTTTIIKNRKNKITMSRHNVTKVADRVTELTAQSWETQPHTFYEPFIWQLLNLDNHFSNCTYFSKILYRKCFLPSLIKGFLPWAHWIHINKKVHFSIICCPLIGSYPINTYSWL